MSAINRFQKSYAIIGLITGWCGLLLQFYLILTLVNSGISFWNRFFNFFSYFTVLTNILAALSFSFAVSSPGTGRFFTKPAVQAAIALYILIVGIIYITVLQKLWQPEGLQWLADIILHYVTPLFFVVYWFLFVPKGKVTWKHCFLWLAYPAGYFVYSLVRGSFTGWYPYPFIDVNAHGYANVLKTAAILLPAFVFAGIIFWGIDKFLAKSVKFRNS